MRVVTASSTGSTTVGSDESHRSFLSSPASSFDSPASSLSSARSSTHASKNVPSFELEARKPKPEVRPNPADYANIPYSSSRLERFTHKLRGCLRGITNRFTPKHADKQAPQGVNAAPHDARWSYALTEEIAGRFVSGEPQPADGRRTRDHGMWLQFEECA